jgi:phage repressor protein C with HTH and peptisase S24 domain
MFLHLNKGLHVSIGQRVSEVMLERGISNARLARMVGVSRPTIGNWIEGKSIPTGENLNNLANVLKVDSNWLLTGKERDILAGFMQVEPWDSDTPLEDDEVEIPFFKDFSFACGSGSMGEALASEKRKLRMSKATLRNRSIDKKNAVATIATGDSMNPTIKDGDTIHIDLGRKTIKDGKIFAICHGGLFMAKRLYSLPFGGIRVVSDNSDEYPEIRLNAEQIKDEQFEIIGWIWQVSSLENW